MTSFCIEGSSITAARVIDAALKRPLTDELLFGRLKDGGRVAVGVEDGELDLRIDA